LKDPRFTDRELDVMSILWREGSGTVAEVRERLADPLAYTSVRGALQTLEEKGFVRHEKEGRAHRYVPLVESRAAGASALGRIVEKVFHGSAELLLAELVAERGLGAAELQRMRDLLDRRLSEEEEDR
jgi:BlaI family penicillinase repressor